MSQRQSELTSKLPPIERLNALLESTPNAALKEVDSVDHIYEANVQPLAANEMVQQFLRLTLRHSDHDLATIQAVHERNAEVLNRSEKIVVVLDGRAAPRKDGERPDQGYLGDVLEASRMCSAVIAAGKKV